MTGAKLTVPDAMAGVDADPGNPIPARSLGVTLAGEFRWAEAERMLRYALSLDPLDAGAWSILGSVLTQQGEVQGAGAALFNALMLSPDMPSARWHRGILNLLLGRWEEGWADYAFGITNGMRPVRHPQPEWHGRPIPGRTLLLWAEQGIGDTLMALRWVKRAKQQAGGRVVLEVPQELAALCFLQGLADEVIARAPDRGIPAAWDEHASLMDLPRILGHSFEQTPYLKAGGAAELPGTGRKIGIVWQGSRLHPADHLRSVPRDALDPLWFVPGIQWYSFQFGEKAPDRSIDVAADLTDWVQTAAILPQLDLLLTCDTAIAHLAGAMGVPCWIMLQHPPDWRWGLAGESTPWYDSVRLFRQPTPGDWAGVVSAVMTALAVMEDPAAPLPPSSNGEVLAEYARTCETPRRYVRC